MSRDTDGRRPTSYVYGRTVDGVRERFVILVALACVGTILHEEHSRGGRGGLLLSRLVPPLPPEQTVEAWLKERDEELQASGWGSPSRMEGVC